MRPPPLLSFDVEPEPSAPSLPAHPRKLKKPWTSYLPILLVVAIILSPQPSTLLLLVRHHLVAFNSLWTFIIHISCIYTLTFLIFSSLIVCISRDPGHVPAGSGTGRDRSEEAVMEPLMVEDEGDYYSAAKWCRHCAGPKPERAHHCSSCHACVLRMDHHCPWLADRCIGHRTYTSFVHFLLSATLLSIYVAVLGGQTLWYFIITPRPILNNQHTPLHALFLVIIGMGFSVSMGSFLCYHIYLIATNQTTLENVSPFLLLRYLPAPSSPPLETLPKPSAPAPTPPPPSTRTSSSSRFQPPFRFPSPPPTQQHQPYYPPEEHELSYKQRRKVRKAHRRIRMYDLGWRNNFAEFFGIPSSTTRMEETGKRNWRSWIQLILWGGHGYGNGRTFTRNPQAMALLARLSQELEQERIRERGGRN